MSEDELMVRKREQENVEVKDPEKCYQSKHGRGNQKRQLKNRAPDTAAKNLSLSVNKERNSLPLWRVMFDPGEREGVLNKLRTSPIMSPAETVASGSRW